MLSRVNSSEIYPEGTQIHISMELNRVPKIQSNIKKEIQSYGLLFPDKTYYKAIVVKTA